MKKVLSTILVFAILCTLSATFVSANTVEQAKKSDTEFFTVMGIFPAEANADSTITRIGLAEIFYNIVFPDKNVSGEAWGTFAFQDVPADKMQFAATAAGLGAMRGYSENVFGPDDAVTYAQAIKAIVAFLGYDLQAGAMGGYPTGYLAQASRLQILSEGNISGDTHVTYGIVAEILKKAINKDIAIWNHTAVDGTAIQDILKGVDYLKYYLGINLTKGKVTGNYLTNIKSGKNTNFFGVYLDGNKMEIAETAHGIQDLIGYDVYVYYKEDGSVKTAVYYELGKNNVIEIDSGSIAGVTGGSVMYYEDGQDSVSSVDFPVNAALIYNGTYEDSFTTADINPFADGNLDGYVRFIDSDGDNVFETIVVTAFKTMVVRDVLNNKIYGEYNVDGKTDVIDISNYKERNINIRNLEGEMVEPDDIKKGVVLNVCADKNGVIKEIIGSKDSMTGVIEEISYVGSKISAIKLSGTEFKTSAGLVLIDAANKLKAGASATVFFNCTADIAFVDLEQHYTDGYNIGYLVDAGIEGGIEKKVLCMIFDSEGEMKTLSLADKVSLNGQGEEALSVFEKFGKTENRVKRQLILYKTDLDGNVVTAIEIPEKLEKDTDAFNGLYEFPGESYYYTGAHKSFNDQYLSNGDTICFAVPSEKDRDKYEFYSMGALSGSVSYTLGTPTAPKDDIRLYGLHEDALVVNYAVLPSSTGSSGGGELSKRPLFVVSKVTTAADKEGDVKLKVSGIYFVETTVLEGSFYIDSNLLISGHESAYATAALPAGTRPFIDQNDTMIEPGDIFRTCYFTDGGNIEAMNCNQFYQLYDIGNNIFLETNGVGLQMDRSASTSTSHWFGHVITNNGTAVKTIRGNDINVENPTYKAYEFTSGHYKFVEVTKHPGNGEIAVEITKASAIRSEKSFPGQGSRVLTLIRDDGIGCVILNFN